MGRQSCRKWHRVFLAGAFALGVLTTPSPLPAQSSVFHSRFSGLAAEASFTGYDPSTESWTEVNLFALDGRRQVGAARPEPTTSLWVQVMKTDPQTGFRWLDGFAATELAGGSFQIDRSLSQASLRTTVRLYDFSSGSYFPLALDLHWKGAGDRSRSTEQSGFVGDGYLFRYRTVGFSRTATAMGVFVLADWSPETLGPASGASLSSTADGYLEVRSGNGP
ncbi:MAG: hypothetical protein ACK47B_20615 [Armatimonadota bacterium]